MAFIYQAIFRADLRYERFDIVRKFREKRGRNVSTTIIKIILYAAFSRRKKNPKFFLYYIKNIHFFPCQRSQVS